MFEQCTFYTNTGLGAARVHMWTNSTSNSTDSIPNPIKGKVTGRGWHGSGTRGILPPAVYLGSMQIGNRNSSVDYCRRQAHIATSPMEIQVIDHKTGSKSNSNSKSNSYIPINTDTKCTSGSGDMDGYWRKLDSTLIKNCPNTSLEDLHLVVSNGHMVTKASRLIESENVTLLYDTVTKTYLFRISDSNDNTNENVNVKYQCVFQW